VLVRTVAMAIERSRADEEREQQLANERAAALTLQHSLLPVVPQAVGAVRLEARYRTGDPGVEVGGDWFDALEVPGGTVLVVGDVQGHDLRAAALMGQLRTVARASAAAGRSPGEVLNSLSRYLGLVNDELLTTALVVQLDVGTGDCRLASAGHLPPLVLRRGDDIQRAWVADDVQIEVGPPLGLGGEWPETTCTLPPDAFLLLYTDGLVETRTWSLEHGLMLLRKAMEGLPATADLTAVLDAALELVPTGSRGDDVAVLAALTPRGAGAAG
jgi:serine phosphatase RsbU (regulator of sigma subunit)